nr:polysaccharide deacetylase family protein [Chloroflexota bacterium]
MTNVRQDQTVERMVRKLAIIWGWWRGRRARTLLYHSIADEPSDPLAVPPSLFVQQIEWLARNRFRVISTDKLRMAISQGLDLPQTIVLTFDDALHDFFDTALPVLHRYGFSATVFVPTGKVGQVSDWSKTHPLRPLMGKEQLTQLVEMGFELGSHTVTHAALPALTEQALMYELKESLAYLQRLTGRNSIPFAYPYGRAGKREQAAVREAGYTSAYLAGVLWGNGKGSDLFCLTRDVMRGDTSLARFISLVNGYLDLWRALSDFIRRFGRSRVTME